MDCLDRTNAFQTKIAYLAMSVQSNSLHETQLITDPKVGVVDQHIEEGTFMEYYKNVWADNGDYISKIYTGTGATTSSTTRKGKGGLLGLIDHKMKSVGRFFIANLDDIHKQKAINILLGKNLDSQSGNEVFEAELEKMEQEFTQRTTLTIGILTWCAYVDSSHINSDLIDKLTHQIDIRSLDVFSVGLQETAKSGGFKLFSGDGKDVAVKYELEFLRFFKNYDITLKKFSTHYNGGMRQLT